MARYIKLYEQLLDWEWFNDPITLKVFIYLLLKANYCDMDFHGVEIKRGQMVTSLSKLSTSNRISIQQARTSLNHLISTGEITSQAYHDYRVITIVKYDEYQGSTSQSTGRHQKSNKQLNKQSTSQLTTSIELNRTIELKNKSLTRFIAPTPDEIQQYIESIKSHVDPDYFYDYYSARGWELKPGQKMKDWKAVIRTWERREKNGRAGNPVSKNDGADDQDVLEQARRGIVYL